MISIFDKRLRYKFVNFNARRGDRCCTILALRFIGNHFFILHVCTIQSERESRMWINRGYSLLNFLNWLSFWKSAIIVAAMKRLSLLIIIIIQGVIDICCSTPSQRLVYIQREATVYKYFINKTEDLTTQKSWCFWLNLIEYLSFIKLFIFLWQWWCL